MLRLKKISKDYQAGDTVVEALKEVDLAFRQNEFVAVLGPSGCGKTTLLNIVGGLDSYTSGELFINGVSTKNFKDRDWDVYRNHRIGFIFQSYNLIPHQSVLANVELALTISGLNKTERIARAKKALDRVGLSDQYNKRPNQLSGGQSQRVAIARSLVNNPEILLADEPTGALDSETSVQIMDLIAEIAKERLVIMVTHNPDLAAKYTNRIIRLLDGRVISDTNPFSVEQEIAQTKKRMAAGLKPPTKENAKMSFWTAFRLSLQNLITKKGRTVMTGVAGSIGIIGVSLVLSLSYGVTTYIGDMQNDMLSGNPIVINKTAFDLNNLSSTVTNREVAEMIEFEDGYINVNSLVEQMIEQSENINGLIVNNNITNDYVNFIKNMPSEDVGAINFNYGIDITNNLYTDFQVTDSSPTQKISIAALRTKYTEILKITEVSDYASIITSLSDTFGEALNNEEYVLSQYDTLPGGRFAKAENEIMIITDNNGMLNDLLLAQLGYYTQDEFVNIIYTATEDPKADESLNKTKFTYDELIGRTFTYYPNDSIIKAPVAPKVELLNPYTYEPYVTPSFTGGVELTITGILKPKAGVNFGSMDSAFYYTEALTEHILEVNKESAALSFLSRYGLDSFTGGIKVTIGSMEVDLGINFDIDFTFEGASYVKNVYLGKSSANFLSSIIGSGGGEFASAVTLEGAEIGGNYIPSGISIYAQDFEHKGNVLDYLDRWNSEEDIMVGDTLLLKENRENIVYTDALSLIIRIMNTMVNIVTTALVGFTALSLVVSTVMIAIITYVSVVERIKEIGVIRALGGRKKDVSNLFNAETFIIGLFSGIIGLSVTYLASLIINLIVNKPLGGIAIAIFPIHYAAIMLFISVLLTTISGLLPSRAAARKDPVVALRTE